MVPEVLNEPSDVLVSAGYKQGLTSVWDKDKVIVVLDHRSPTISVAAAERYRNNRELAKKYGLTYFYDIDAGISHQVLPEKGHVTPGQLIVGKDSHSTTYGAFNAAGTGIGATEMAYVLGTGELWFRVPETIRFMLNGTLSPFVYAKDIMLHIAGSFGTEVAQYKSIEWDGPLATSLSIDSRMTMSNMSVELGAKFGLFEADEKTNDFLRSRVQKPITPVRSDSGAVFEEEYDIDVSGIEPQVACPDTVGNVKPISEIKGVPIDQAVIGSCTNGRFEDLEIAAQIVEGKRVHPGTRFIVGSASAEVYEKALAAGLIYKLAKSGAIITNPGCGVCIGSAGALAKGEVCIAATPRNFKGRMGSYDAKIYLASPATVAASALRGVITDPRDVV